MLNSISILNATIHLINLKIPCSSDVLIQPDPDKPYKLETDASKFAIGCVLSQKVGRVYKPNGYYSRSLTRRE